MDQCVCTPIGLQVDIATHHILLVAGFTLIGFRNLPSIAMSTVFPTLTGFDEMLLSCAIATCLHPISMHKILKLARLGLLMGLLANAQSVLAQHPADQWEVAVETGYLKKVKNNTPLNYVIVPTQVAWRAPAAFDLWQGSSGARLAVRNRLAIVVETFVEGAEDYYVAFAGSPTFELWTADQKTALFYEIGGGAGLLNSKHVEGGQGQNFTFNWFTQLGVRRQLRKKLAVTGAAYFTHHSNMGMTKPNPGIDVLGYNVGLVWTID